MDVGRPAYWWAFKLEMTCLTDKDLNMVYCWDEDNVSDVVGSVPGFFGYKFESPGQPYDFIDNDNDGMITNRKIMNR